MDTPLKTCREIKYLGLTDDKDINHQCRKLYAQENMLLPKFSMCSVNVI